MARITVEDCLEKIGNMYDLVLLAAKRVRQMQRGSEPMVKSKNRNTVVALREIADGKVSPDNIRQHDSKSLDGMAPPVTTTAQ